jgi:hypothetical protein
MRQYAIEVEHTLDETERAKRMRNSSSREGVEGIDRLSAGTRQGTRTDAQNVARGKLGRRRRTGGLTRRLTERVAIHLA